MYTGKETKSLGRVCRSALVGWSCWSYHSCCVVRWSWLPLPAASPPMARSFAVSRYRCGVMGNMSPCWSAMHDSRRRPICRNLSSHLPVSHFLKIAIVSMPINWRFVGFSVASGVTLIVILGGCYLHYQDRGARTVNAIQ